MIFLGVWRQLSKQSYSPDNCSCTVQCYWSSRKRRRRRRSSIILSSVSGAVYYYHAAPLHAFLNVLWVRNRKLNHYGYKAYLSEKKQLSSFTYWIQDVGESHPVGMLMCFFTIIAMQKLWGLLEGSDNSFCMPALDDSVSVFSRLPVRYCIDKTNTHTH